MKRGIAWAIHPFIHHLIFFPFLFLSSSSSSAELCKVSSELYCSPSFFLWEDNFFLSFVLLTFFHFSFLFIDKTLKLTSLLREDIIYDVTAQKASTTQEVVLNIVCVRFVQFVIWCVIVLTKCIFTYHQLGVFSQLILRITPQPSIKSIIHFHGDIHWDGGVWIFNSWLFIHSFG